MSGNQPPPFDDLLDALQVIGKALKNPRTADVRKRVPKEVADRHLDYRAIRELMGKPRKNGDPIVTFAASRIPIPGTTLSAIGLDLPLPEKAVFLAVFTGRTDPAELVDLESTTFVWTSAHKQSLAKTLPASRAALTVTSTAWFDLTQVQNSQPIIRLEFRRRGGYPIALGPRLAPV